MAQSSKPVLQPKRSLQAPQVKELLGSALTHATIYEQQMERAREAVAAANMLNIVNLRLTDVHRFFAALGVIDADSAFPAGILSPLKFERTSLPFSHKHDNLGGSSYQLVFGFEQQNTRSSELDEATSKELPDGRERIQPTPETGIATFELYGYDTKTGKRTDLIGRLSATKIEYIVAGTDPNNTHVMIRSQGEREAIRHFVLELCAKDQALYLSARDVCNDVLNMSAPPLGSNGRPEGHTPYAQRQQESVKVAKRVAEPATERNPAPTATSTTATAASEPVDTAHAGLVEIGRQLLGGLFRGSARPSGSQSTGGTPRTTTRPGPQPTPPSRP